MKDEKRLAESMQVFLGETGLWEDSRRRFLIPASNHFINQENVDFIKKVGPEIVSLLKITDRLMGKAVSENDNQGAMKYFRNAAVVGIPKARRKIQKYFKKFPESVKVDFVKGVDGKFYIVEIDTVNTHGLGYGKILKKMCSFLDPVECDCKLKGTETLLNYNPLEVIVPFKDRFHEGEWKATSKLIKTLTFHRESEVNPEDLRGKILLDISHKLNKDIQDKLVEMFSKNEVEVLISPKDQLGSKNVLPFVWNTRTQEALMTEGLTSEGLNLVKNHLPESLFVQKNTDLGNFSDKSWLLKEVNSNAMKGVTSPSACDLKEIGNYSFILQRKIEQTKQSFQFFDEDCCVKESDLYSRYIVYFNSLGNPMECLYTATNEELTHGGIGAVFGTCWSECDCHN